MRLKNATQVKELTVRVGPKRMATDGVDSSRREIGGSDIGPRFHGDPDKTRSDQKNDSDAELPGIPLSSRASSECSPHDHVTLLSTAIVSSSDTCEDGDMENPEPLAASPK